MGKHCQLTGKRPMVGNAVSHANNKTKRRFEPNLQTKRFYIPSEGRWVKLRLSARAIKAIDLIGVDSAVARMRASGEQI